MTTRNDSEKVAVGRLRTGIRGLGIRGFEEIVDSVLWAFGGLSDHERLVGALRQRRAGVHE